MRRGLFGIIARQDLAVLRRDRLLAGTLVVLGLLLAFALWSTATVVRDHREAARAFAADIDAKQQALGPDIGATAIRRAVVLPDGSLSTLSLGRTRLDPFTTTAQFTTRADQMFLNYQTDSPMALALGSFDPAFVVLEIIPLIIIALGYGLIATDRDGGRLRLLLAAGTTHGQLMGPRTLVRAVLVAIPVLVAAVLGVALMGGHDPLAWQRLALWVFAALVYMAFWWSLAAAANRLPLRAEAVAALLIVLWAIWALVVPTLTAAAATAMSPAPSRAALVADIRHAQSGILSEFEARYHALESTYPELATGKGAEDFVKRGAVVRLGIEAAFRDRLAAFDDAVAGQAAIARAAAWLSPTLSVSEAMVESAGTSQRRYARYRRQAVAYKDALQHALLLKGLSDTPLSTDEAAGLPRFVFSESAPVVPASLFLWMALTLILAFIARRGIDQAV